MDLIYLDPPFNSDVNYNVLFRAPSGTESDAQVEAFRDTWVWAESAQSAYDDVIQANGDVALVISNLKKWLGENAMMAYVVMMAARLIELRRVLKPNGSLDLHGGSLRTLWARVGPSGQGSSPEGVPSLQESLLGSAAKLIV